MKKSAKSKSRGLAASKAVLAPAAATGRLLADVRALIEAARRQVAQAVNAGLVTLYWHVGKRIRQEVLGEERAAYGQQIVNALSTQLTGEYGRGFTRTNLSYMMRFAEVFPDEQYLTEFPPQELLQRKLHDAILLAREQLARQAETVDATPQIEPSRKGSRPRKKRL